MHVATARSPTLERTGSMVLDVLTAKSYEV